MLYLKDSEQKQRVSELLHCLRGWGALSSALSHELNLQQGWALRNPLKKKQKELFWTSLGSSSSGREMCRQQQADPLPLESSPGQDLPESSLPESATAIPSHSLCIAQRKG